jgi:hypothetical protein
MHPHAWRARGNHSVDQRHEIAAVDNTLTRIGKPPVDRIFGARRASASAPAVTLAISAYVEQPRSRRATTKKKKTMAKKMLMSRRPFHDQ